MKYQKFCSFKSKTMSKNKYLSTTNDNSPDEGYFGRPSTKIKNRPKLDNEDTTYDEGYFIRLSNRIKDQSKINYSHCNECHNKKADLTVEALLDFISGKELLDINEYCLSSSPEYNRYMVNKGRSHINYDRSKKVDFNPFAKIRKTI